MTRFGPIPHGDIRPPARRVDTKGGGVTLAVGAGLAGRLQGDLWFKTSNTERFLAALGAGAVRAAAKAWEKRLI